MDVPAGYADLFSDDSCAFLVLATTRPDGAPSIAPVWFVTDAHGLLFTTGRDSPKARDMRARAEVGAMVMDQGQYARYVSVRGRVTELIDPAAEGIDAQALHRRIVRRYERRDPEQPFTEAVFRLVPARMRGYDYRGYTA